MSETIIIRKQKFRIKTNSEELALQLRHELNDHLQVGLLTMYEEVFATIPGLKNDTVYIDKLQLDLGRCDMAEFAIRLPALLKQAMLKKLNPQQNVDEAAIFTRASDNTKQKTGPAGSMDTVTALFHFFEKGFFPWWVAGMGRKKKPVEMMEELSEQAAVNLLVKIISAAKQFGSEKAIKIQQRFLQHLPVNDRVRIIDALIALQSDQQLKNNIQLLAAEATMQYCCSFISITTEMYRQELIRFLLQPTLQQEKEILQSFIRQLMAKKKTSESKMQEFKKEIKEGGQSASSLHAAINTVIDELSDNKMNDEVEISAKEKDPASNTNENIIANKTSEQKFNKQSAQKKLSTSVTDEIPEEGVYVENGGLIILHPFLQPLFTELELLSTEGIFVANETKQRAAVVVNYLLTGSTEYAEYDMLLNKLLCGLTIEDVLPADILLTEKETRECDGLLETVIRYWDALKGASKEAIRETFFQRKAKVRFKDDHWLMQVERSAMDILLDRLPWGIGIVRLPWLQYLIHVEW